METPAVKPKFCIICGYDLSHAPEDRCSECGVRFDRDDKSTFSTTPSLVHRLVVHTPRIRAWINDQFGTINCRCCGRLLEPAARTRCPTCNSRYDHRDLTTVTRSLSLIPPAVLRFQHMCLWRGMIFPAAVLIYGLSCLATGSAVLPAVPRYGLVHLSGFPAMAMAASCLGLAIALHAHYFWGRVEPCWRYSAIPTTLGLALFVGGWGYALWWSVASAFGP